MEPRSYIHHHRVVHFESHPRLSIIASDTGYNRPRTGGLTSIDDYYSVELAFLSDDPAHTIHCPHKDPTIPTSVAQLFESHYEDDEYDLPCGPVAPYVTQHELRSVIEQLSPVVFTVTSISYDPPPPYKSAFQRAVEDYFNTRNTLN